MLSKRPTHCMRILCCYNRVQYNNIAQQWNMMTSSNGNISCISKLTIIGSDNGLLPGRLQAIYLNQCWNIFNSNLRNKPHWNFKQNHYIFIQDIWKYRLRNGSNFASASMCQRRYGVSLVGSISDLCSICHYSDIIMGTIASQITSLTIVYSTVYFDADQRKHQSSPSLAFVWGIQQGISWTKM